MSSTGPSDHPSSLPGESKNVETAPPVTSAVPAGSKAETDLLSLENNYADGKPTLSAKAAGKQQATDDLIDFGDDTPGPEMTATATANTGSKPVGWPAQTISAPAPESTTEALTSSVATLKPTSPLPPQTATQYLTIESTSAPYVDPTPPTPRTSQPPSRTPSNAGPRRASSDGSPTRSDAGYDERRYASEDEQENGSRSEIQSIMEQFTGDGGGPGADEVMSPRLEFASPMLGSPGLPHPPRKSSLEPLAPSLSHQVQELQGLRIQTASPSSIRSRERPTDDQGPPVPPKDGPPATPSKSHDDRQMSVDSQMSPSLHRPPPPEPEPEPALPFDFHRFLEQLRNKKADPVARYLKSFLSEFAKRQWMVHEQVKIISDFLAFIANKMAQCEVWREVSDAEFDNAREGMEKLVMNRLYTQTFSPAIPPPQPIPGAKPKRRGGERPMGPGRRGQHQEDVERDDVLTQKINIYAWLREEHLDIPPAGESGRRFLELAQKELLKIKSYRAPRDKIICVLNCCKVIFGLLKHSKSDSSADSFMPLLIYVVLQANPEHLVSNVQYILRFRNQEKLGGEAGYYLSSLMGAIQFIENMDRTTLTITDEEFEKNVEAAVSAIAEKHRLDSPHPVQEPTFNEKTGHSYPSGESSTRPSFDIGGGDSSSMPRRSTSSNEGADSDQAPISGLLRSIQRPLSTIGRMFSDEPSPPAPGPSNANRPVPPEKLSPRPSMEVPPEGQRHNVHHQLSAEEAAARQASAEAAEAQRLHRAEHDNVVETLASMFPDLDREIISDVVYQKQGRVGLAVDACLALTS
ncbi:guanine nucleotide exchange factor vps9 [Colletotrichum sojae]|uniref:Guanine nucleotide exchange factor vps9 n=1 Tax=Colletotrichum sojae TaxID=2175907 RepID=A0A8H6IUK5_9PEZI|nr:guanine nucleotide exchange factor vps9 [Colletotrichum sojae]